MKYFTLPLVFLIIFVFIIDSLKAVPVFFDTGGNQQLCFNNSLINTTNPTFRISSSSGNYKAVKIEINTKSDFTGAAVTQIFSGSYSSNVQYNFTFTNFNPNNNTTYYVRAQVSTNGSGYGSWSSGYLSFTYTNIQSSSAGWFQTTQAQFNLCTFSNLQANSTNDVSFIPFNSGSNPVKSPCFSSSSNWTSYISYKGTNYAIYLPNSGDGELTGGCSTNVKFYEYGGYYYGGDRMVVSQLVNFSGLSQLIFDAESWTINQMTVIPANQFQLECWIGGTSTGRDGTLMHTTLQSSCNTTFSDCGDTHIENDITLNTSGFSGNQYLKFICYLAGGIGDLGGGEVAFWADNIRANAIPPTTGTIISPAINLSSFNNASGWSKLKWNQTLNNGNIVFKIQKYSGGNWIDVSNLTDISSASDGTQVADISSLGNEGQIRIYGTFTNSAASPVLSDWAVTVNIACNPPALNIISNKTSACPGSLLNLSANPQGGANCNGNWVYTWSDGKKYWDGSGFSLDDVNYSKDFQNINFNNFSATTTYTAIVRCDSAQSCSTSGNIIITLLQKPSVASEPQNQQICPGQTALFSLTSSGSSPFSYQWMKLENKGWTAISDATTNSYQLMNITESDTGYYKCIVNNSCGFDTSSIAMLSLKESLQLISGFTNYSKCFGDSVTFDVELTGSQPISYQWRKLETGIWQPVSGATNSVYSISSITSSDAGSYSCLASNECNNLNINGTLSVNSPPQILTLPVSQQKCSGDKINYSISVSGTGPFIFQWKKDNILIPGASNDNFQLTNITQADTGHYTCSVTNNCGSTIADVAYLDIYPLPIINLGKDTAITKGDSLTLEAGSGFAAYLWNNGSTDSTLEFTTAALDTGIYKIFIKVTDKNVCSNSDTINIKIILSAFYYSISGMITYDNVDATPMSLTTLYLYQHSAITDQLIDSAKTDLSGNYYFSKVSEGTYIFKIKTLKKWGGSNPVDALKINRYFIGAYSFKDYILKKAADVNADSRINPIDALLVNRRFIGAVKSFPAGNWYFDINQFIMQGSDFKYDFKSICFGDVDGSY